MVRKLVLGIVLCGSMLYGAEARAYDTNTVKSTAINGNIAQGKSYLIYNNYTNTNVFENFNGSSTANAGGTASTSGFIDCSDMVGDKIIRTNLTAVTGTYTQRTYVFFGTSTIAGTTTAVLFSTETRTTAGSVTVTVGGFCRGIAVATQQAAQGVAGTSTYSIGLDYGILK